MDSLNNESKIFFTSDIHFGHKNIMKYTSRTATIGSDSVEDMNEFLVNAWNEKVPSEGIVYVLGDISFCNFNKTSSYFSRLKGCIHLILGNHDNHKIISRMEDRFTSISKYRELKVNNQHIILSHYPFYSWNGCQKGSWCVHGHEHGSIRNHEHSLKHKIMDVGVDCHPLLQPFSYSEVKAHMADKALMVHHNNIHQD